MTKTKNEAVIRKHPPLKIYDGLELASSPPEKHIGVVHGLLQAVGVSMWVGKPKSGKSSLLRQLAVCVADGLPFLDRQTQMGSVLLLSLEGAIGKVQEHLSKLAYTGENAELKVVHEHLPYDEPSALQLFEEAIQAVPNLKLVIVDPARKLLRGTDWDSYNDTPIGVEKLEQLAKKYGVHIAFSNHAKKRETDDPGDAAIGSTGLRAGTDTNVFLTRKGKQRIIETEVRWGTEIEPTLLVWNPDREEMALGMTVAESDELSHEQKQNNTVQRIREEILDALLGRRLSTADLLKAVKGEAATKLRVLQQMVSDGQVIKTPEGKAVLYSLAELPTEEVKAA